jgi:glyoxylase-like metal-dependent hydrolase (beta-lactamase superfamily II)
MTGGGEEGSLPVARLVQAAGGEEPAIEIAPRIWMSRDISNSYAIATEAGTLLLNAGTVAGGPLHRARYDAAGLAPYGHLVLTQSHIDHYGGLQAFGAPGPRVVAHRRFRDNLAYRDALRPYYGPRALRIWATVLGDQLPPEPDFAPEPNIVVGDRETLDIGGRRIELISTPGGETTDALSLWLPDEGTVFTGNLFGPAFMTVPNLNPIRCDKPRSAMEYVRSAKTILALGAELLVTGHGDPIRGAARIAADVRRLRDAVLSIYEQTLEGMSAGLGLHALMARVALPDALRLSESYGTVAWAVRTIWEEHTGWFHQDRTTDLYEVPQAAIVPELVALAGADRIAAAAAAHLAAGRPLEALHLTELLLGADPAHPGGLSARRGALAELSGRAEGRQNLNETMWLRSELAAVGKAGMKPCRIA